MTTVKNMVQKKVFIGDLLNSSISSLLSFEDTQGLLRVKIRLSQLDLDFIHPILQPAEYPVVEKLIREELKKACHAGVEGLIGILR